MSRVTLVVVASVAVQDFLGAGLDTAPTGHTVLLLDAAESYRREINRINAQVPAPSATSPTHP